MVILGERVSVPEGLNTPMFAFTFGTKAPFNSHHKSALKVMFPVALGGHPDIHIPNLLRNHSFSFRGILWASGNNTQAWPGCLWPVNVYPL